MNELLAAGGTGQEVAAAVIRLAYLAGIEAPRVTVFDSDVAPRPAGDAARTRSQVLDDLQKRLVAAGVWGEARLTTLNPATVGDTLETVHVVRDVYATHGALSSHDGELLDLLLDDKQQQVTITDGFHGHPAVGSLVFASALEQRAFQDFMTRVRANTDGAAETRVLLAASVAGGTGTAVVPMLVRRLAALRNTIQVPDKLRLLALLQLPWFQLKKVENEAQSAAPDVDDTQFDRNQTGLLRGYLEAVQPKDAEGVRTKDAEGVRAKDAEGVRAKDAEGVHAKDLDALFLLGLPKRAQRTSHGGHQQLETRHYLCVLAGLLALDLLDAEASKELLGNSANRVHALQLGEGATGYDGRPSGPVLGHGARTFTLRQLVYVASGLRALTAALQAEAAHGQPTQAQNASVRRTLHALPHGAEREAFRRALATLHELHVDIHGWLSACLGSELDTNGVGFPEPQAREAFGAWDIGTVLRRNGAALPFPPVGRRLLQRLLHGAPHDGKGKGDGKEAAWALVRHARERLLNAA